MRPPMRKREGWGMDCPWCFKKSGKPEKSEEKEKKEKQDRKDEGWLFSKKRNRRISEFWTVVLTRSPGRECE
ncbi:hypothetical protein TNCV_1794621 [Trichonephila clavipes]|nr:hypothetical protein TNCV_1794621 [Trichonephila clavipes]